ncbi:MAG: 50S ribosomal protein L24 [Atopobiaceae bacterium]|jgi:large subunit ribosomal protein L24|nr:50S ribosomal protein L24 [Atopobiaceae bacterium]MCH4119727.1 50S ribosomal protein L24 [Atopobiaceae bacterium]MCI1388801.1 50S ribosomal protein L24 [Atopobiaceae bacterium]MCI1432579.1 50S ribosomal protein L24 [Atopobiaceae bacterium]MCI1471084.1 50S ribosomal protein L24 [Atopobiaceae bacterium]
MAKMNVRKGDTVEVLAGKDKGARGEVIEARPAEGKVVVRDVAVVKKAVRPNPLRTEGGIVSQEAAIDVSNVALVCPTCGKATRVGHAVDENGKKVRVCKKCGAQF